MKLSNYVSYEEAIASARAKKMGIENKPSDLQLENMTIVAQKIFDPVRERFGVRIGISSFFRSEALNKVTPGSSNTSQHTTGEAMDIDAKIYGGVTNKEIFKFIKDNLTFDQLIYEFGDDTNPAWVHVSLKKDKNRKQVLKSKKVNGVTIYSNY